MYCCCYLLPFVLLHRACIYTAGLSNQLWCQFISVLRKIKNKKQNANFRFQLTLHNSVKVLHLSTLIHLSTFLLQIKVGKWRTFTEKKTTKCLLNTNLLQNSAQNLSLAVESQVEPKKVAMLYKVEAQIPDAAQAYF